MLNSGHIIAFVATANLDRAYAFYAGVLGLDPVEKSDSAAEFRVGATVLRLTRVDEIVIAPYPVLGWSVVDIEREVRELTDRGVIFRRDDTLPHDDLGIVTSAGGDRAAWFVDPDGHTLSLTQPVRPG